MLTEYSPEEYRQIHETAVDFGGLRFTNKVYHVVQYDKTLPIVKVKLYSNGRPFEVSSTMFIKVRWSKPDKTFVYKDIKGYDPNDHSVVYFEVDQQMSSAYGHSISILELSIDGNIAGSSPMEFIIDRNPIQEHDVESHIEYTLSTVARTGDYNDLLNLPYIPPDIQADLEAEVNRAKQKETSIEAKIDNEVERAAEKDEEIEEKINKNVNFKTSSKYFNVSGDDVTFTLKYHNLNTGAESNKSEVLPLADQNGAGLMSPSDVKAISQLQSDVAGLKGQNVRLTYTTKNNPTATEIKNFVISSGYDDQTKWSSIAVVIKYEGGSNNNHIWKYSNNELTWSDTGLDIVTQFSNTIAGIIKGSATDGKLYAENDGTGSVYGWSELKNRVLACETSLGNKLNKVGGKYQVYINDSNGNQSTIQYDTSAVSYTIVLRNANGQINTAAPTSDNNATTKKYVDDLAATKQAVISDLTTIRSNAASGAAKISCTDAQVASYGYIKQATVDGKLDKSGGTMTGDLFYKKMGSNPSSGAINGGFYFFNSDSSVTSQYGFGLYQWGNVFQFTVRNNDGSAGGGWKSTAFEIDGSTGRTDFKVNPTINGAAIATTSQIPTKTSQLTNDSKYAVLDNPSQTGNFYATNFFGLSDKRLKKHIRKFKYDKSILDLNVYTYDFKKGSKNQIGCIAQELQELYPNLVVKNEEGFLSIQENKIVYLLLEEVKNLKKELDTLKKKVGE